MQEIPTATCFINNVQIIAAKYKIRILKELHTSMNFFTRNDTGYAPNTCARPCEIVKNYEQIEQVHEFIVKLFEDIRMYWFC